ncbi:MAG: hypothetical protein QXF35_02415 [Candidatus Bilamarchaeaceae archaeon]
MVYYEKLQKMFKEGKYAEIKSFCESELQLHPNDIDLTFYYASSLEALGEHEKARNYFEKLFNLTKENIFLICKSIPSFALGERAKAKEDIEKVLKVEKDPNILFYAFKVAVKNGESTTAKHGLFLALKTSPEKTIENLQKFFEEVKGTSIERRVFFVSIINLLRSLPK